MKIQHSETAHTSNTAYDNDVLLSMRIKDTVLHSNISTDKLKVCHIISTDKMEVCHMRIIDRSKALHAYNRPIEGTTHTLETYRRHYIQTYRHNRGRVRDVGLPCEVLEDTTGHIVGRSKDASMRPAVGERWGEGSALVSAWSWPMQPRMSSGPLGKGGERGRAS